MGASAFYAGLTGLNANAAALATIGNNLANTNTIGFKTGRTNFAQLFAPGAAAVNGAGVPQQIGLGVTVSGVQTLFTAGSLQPTDVVTDMALQGGGFFTLETQEGLSVFSRAGNFSFNSQGNLVNDNGFRVQGYTQKDADGKVVTTGVPQDIVIPAGLTAPPQASGYFQASMNLQNGATQPFVTGINVFDSLGAQHDVTLVMTPTSFAPTGAVWGWEARVPAADIAGAPTGPTDPEYIVVATGTMTFDGNGQLVANTMTGWTPPTTETPPIYDLPLVFDAANNTGWANGASAQTVTWNVVDPNIAAPQRVGLITGYDAPSEMDGLSTDGYGVGQLQSLAVSADGLIAGVFTNGQTLELGQLAVASFNNSAGLQNYYGNTYISSLGSGPPALGIAGTGGRGTVVSKALELSNVDITDQFTQMIVAERGYQANTKIITTMDQLAQETINIKR